MSMYDAFKYFEPMANLVADEGVDVNVAPHGWLARVIRVLRGRRTLPQPARPAMTLVRSALGPPAASRTQTAA